MRPWSCSLQEHRLRHLGGRAIHPLHRACSGTSHSPRRTTCLPTRGWGKPSLLVPHPRTILTFSGWVAVSWVAQISGPSPAGSSLHRLWQLADCGSMQEWAVPHTDSSLPFSFPDELPNSCLLAALGEWRLSCRKYVQLSWPHTAAQWSFKQQPPVPVVLLESCWSSLSVVLDSGAPAATSYELASLQLFPVPLTWALNGIKAMPGQGVLQDRREIFSLLLLHHVHDSPRTEQG